MDDKEILQNEDILWTLASVYYIRGGKDRECFKKQFTEAFTEMIKIAYKKGQNSVLESELSKLREIRTFKEPE